MEPDKKYFLDLCLLEHRDKFVKVMNELELLYSNTINPDSYTSMSSTQRQQESLINDQRGDFTDHYVDISSANRDNSRRVRSRVLGYSVEINQFEIPHSPKRRTPIHRRIQFRNKKHMRQYMNNLRFFKNTLF